MKRFKVQKTINGVPHENGNRYLIVNVDESYAEDVFKLIRDNEKAKGTWDAPDNFKEFIEQI